MIVVAFYTRDTAYEAEAALLRASLDRAGMRHYIAAFDPLGDWHDNVAVKPELIRQMRHTQSGGLLYIDVDAFVHEPCAEYFDELNADGVDFSAHWFAGPSGGYRRERSCACLSGQACDRPHRLLSGTLFFGDTAGARTLLDLWCIENEARRLLGERTGGGQRNLFRTLMCDQPYIGVPAAAASPPLASLRIRNLPGRFCYVFDKPWAYPPGEPCIIEHTIASRDWRPHDDGRPKRPDEKNAARRDRRAELARLVNLTEAP